MLENLSIALFLLYFVSFYLQPVASHGYVANITIDGKVYIGNVPGAETTASVIRQVNTIDPVQPANNSNMGCGPGASPASLVASASPGSEFLIHWAGGDDQDWPHEVGPLMAYLASCGDESCTTFNTSGASWFKIHQVARVDGVWVQLDIHDGQPANLSLPSNLAPGNYILRHEIIALQNAVYIGGAEFYPSCSQLEVNGSQTGKPNSSDLVSFPGAYSETDPGIYDPDVYDTSVKYIFPGPAIASFITGSTAGSDDGSADSGSSSDSGSDDGDSSSNSSSSQQSFSTKQQCRLKSPDTSSNSRRSLFGQVIERFITRVGS